MTNGNHDKFTLRHLQRALNISQDGHWGPVTRDAFLSAFINRNAPAIVHADYELAARRLGCHVAQIKAFAAVESGGASFSIDGRPKILFEAHYFSRLTAHRYDGSHPDISSRRWNRNLYARHMPGRYARLARAVALDAEAGLSSISIGKFQIMVAHWRALDYSSPWDMCMRHVESEQNHLAAFVRYIVANGLQDALRQCVADDPDSCRDIVFAYNGPAYAANNYHVRLARQIAVHSA